MSADATAREQARSGKRRIVFNWDGNDVLAWLKNDATPENLVRVAFFIFREGAQHAS